MDADAWLAMQRAAIESGSWRGRDDRTTVGEFADEWVKALQVRDRTRYHYKVNLDKWIKPTFGTTPMSAVTPAMVRKWVGSFSSDTPAARANAYRVLSQVFRAAVEDGIVTETPVRVKGAGQYTRKREGHALQASEVYALSEKVPEGRRLAILLAAFCALRPGEVLGLRRRDVDPRTHSLSIRETASAVHAGTSRVGPVKTSSSVRTVHYPSAVQEAVLEHLTKHTGAEPTDHLFPSPRGDGQPLSYGGYLHMFKRAAEDAELSDLKPHDLRHTGATLAAATGATTRELMARLGHTSPTVAMRYQHAAKERDKNIADALGGDFSSTNMNGKGREGRDDD
ncbi:tyrosine-type recombinase/integrase [Brachybacterium sp. GCM10030267]|uniref:tyrosine-type recombinase/integrase n=1 Tax=Brachybacterium sp. GCM10030267 TaxID=3273381 RepID=UPI003606B8D7